MNSLIAMLIHTFASTTSPTACAPLDAARVAQLADADVHAPTTLDAIEAIADEPGGIRCLLDSWTLAKVYLAQHRPAALTALLARALEQRDDALAARAANVVRILGVASPDAFADIVGRVELTARGLARLQAELDHMPAGAKKDLLSASLHARVHQGRQPEV